MRPVTNYYLTVFCISVALIIAFLLYKKIQRWYLLKEVTAPHRGTRSERDLVIKLLKYGIPAQHIFHDLYLEKYKGHFSQIDLVAITDFGIVVFEVKEYSGWIFGNANQLQWTQVLGYGQYKYRFYNPIKQNRTHISELTKQLSEFHQLPVYSMIVFYGNCELKEIDLVPEGTFIIKPGEIPALLKHLLKNKVQVAQRASSEVVRVLKTAVVNGGIVENTIRHHENVRTMKDKMKIFD
jgi:Nuclease-related domain